MIDFLITLAYINTGLWFVTAIVFFIGFMTYADYYTKNADNFIFGFNFCFVICGVLSLCNFVATIAQNSWEVAVQRTIVGFSCLTLVIYVIALIAYTIILGSKFRQYCGTKRGKL